MKVPFSVPNKNEVLTLHEGDDSDKQADEVTESQRPLHSYWGDLQKKSGVVAKSYNRFIIHTFLCINYDRFVLEGHEEIPANSYLESQFLDSRGWIVSKVLQV